MRGLIVTVALFAAACGTLASESTVEPTPATSSTTTNTAPTTTKSTTPAPTTIPEVGSFTRFEPGISYRGALDAVNQEFELSFQTDSWRVVNMGTGVGRFVRFSNTSSSPGAELLLMAFMPELGPDAVVSWFLDHPNLAEATSVESTEVGGLPASVLDIRVAESEPDADPGYCIWARMSTVADSDLSTAGVDRQYIYACTWTRVWVLEVDNWTITVAGMPAERSFPPGDDFWQIEEFEPLLDDFINAITFCTEANPCDG